jgi:hypothetical protein
MAYRPYGLVFVYVITEIAATRHNQNNKYIFTQATIGEERLIVHLCKSLLIVIIKLFWHHTVLLYILLF